MSNVGQLIDQAKNQINSMNLPRANIQPSETPQKSTIRGWAIPV